MKKVWISVLSIFLCFTMMSCGSGTTEGILFIKGSNYSLSTIEHGNEVLVSFLQNLKESLPTSTQSSMFLDDDNLSIIASKIEEAISGNHISEEKYLSYINYIDENGVSLVDAYKTLQKSENEEAQNKLTSFYSLTLKTFGFEAVCHIVYELIFSSFDITISTYQKYIKKYASDNVVVKAYTKRIETTRNDQQTFKSIPEDTFNNVFKLCILLSNLAKENYENASLDDFSSGEILLLLKQIDLDFTLTTLQGALLIKLSEKIPGFIGKFGGRILENKDEESFTTMFLNVCHILNDIKEQCTIPIIDSFKNGEKNRFFHQVFDLFTEEDWTLFEGIASLRFKGYDSILKELSCYDSIIHANIHSANECRELSEDAEILPILYGVLKGMFYATT